MAHLQTDLREFIALLNSHGVEYLVVGGHAVAFHGYPRFTGDIDFFFRPTPENCVRLVECLKDFGFSDAAFNAEELATPNRVVQLGRVPNRIDLLSGISGLQFDDAWESRVAGQLDGLPVQFIGRDALIRNKTASDRDQDRADVKKLREIASRDVRSG